MLPAGLPPILRGPFSVEQAVAAGIGGKAVRRLSAAGLLREDPVGLLRLVAPARPDQLALVAVGPPAALCRTTAAAFYGWPLLDPPAAVHLVVPPWRSPACWPAARIHRQSLPGPDVVQVKGVAVTAPVRTALDVAATEPLAAALVVLDSLLRRGILDRRHLRDGLERCAASRGRRRQVLAVSLADGRRASPPESVFRALAYEARLPAPVEQFAVFVDGQFVGRVDFAWPRRRVLVEIDGFAFHSDMQSFVRDHRRQNQLTNAGWRVLRFAAVDLRGRPEAVLDEVRAALALPLPRRAC